MSKFVPRTTAPNRTDKRAINYKYGGTSIAIAIDTQSGYTMPNCVGYFNFRMAEILGLNSVNWKIPACNAEDCYDKAIENGWQVGQTPKLGAGIVWRAGKTHNASDGAGHIGIVEEIKENGDLVISQSAWGGQEFYLSTVTKDNGYAYRPDRPLVGFIYCGIEFEQPQPTPTPIIAGQKVELNNTNCYNSESTPTSYGQKTGTYYLWDDVVKNGRIRITNSLARVGVAGQVTCWVNVKDLNLVTQPIKKELTRTSYPDYPSGSGKVYRVRKSYNDGASSKGSFEKWGYGFDRWNENKATHHIYDCNGKQLD